MKIKLEVIKMARSISTRLPFPHDRGLTIPISKQHSKDLGYSAYHKSKNGHIRFKTSDGLWHLIVGDQDLLADVEAVDVRYVGDGPYDGWTGNRISYAYQNRAGCWLPVGDGWVQDKISPEPTPGVQQYVCTLEKAWVGRKVFNLEYGEGVIIVIDNSENYPIRAKFGNTSRTYSTVGKYLSSENQASLFTHNITTGESLGPEKEPKPKPVKVIDWSKIKPGTRLLSKFIDKACYFGNTSIIMPDKIGILNNKSNESWCCPEKANDMDWCLKHTFTIHPDQKDS